MNQAVHQQIVSLIWGVADDVLRDIYNRGKYRDVILPMTVLRRLDAALEPTKQAVLQLKKTLDDAGIVNQEQALRDAAGQDFYNTSEFRLRDLTTATGQTKLRQNFEAYLDGFSENVQEIINNFDFRHQVPKLVAADALALLIEKFLDPRIDLSPAGLDGLCQAAWSRSGSALASSVGLGRLMPTMSAGAGVWGGRRNRSGCLS